MPAPALAFLMTPQGQALLGAILSEAPALVGKLFAIWSKKGIVSAEEIAEFLASYKPPDTFYAEPQP